MQYRILGYLVHRVWQEAGLKPHRLERYLASNDPDFEAKAADVIGLYLNPPQHAAVFCMDEKTAIQALDRLDPVLPLSPGRAERHGFEYYRPGTQTPPLHQRLFGNAQPIRWKYSDVTRRIRSNDLAATGH
jgi:DNA-binding LacI/PurR family transcriptional regulator